MQNEKFGRLLKAAINSIATIEGKTNPIIEEELGQKISLSPAAIQRYKAGHIPPETRTIELMAEMAIKRGFLYREWLINFLQAARYPAPDKLIEKLCPANSSRSIVERIYQNLPPATYSQFVMRSEAYVELVDGLARRSAVVLVVGMGGMGKTSLAREVAARCLDPESDAPKFDAVVWVSDKDRPGTTSLSTVLDEISRTLDYPGFTQFEFEEKKREVEQLLRRQHVLLVLDNFETITDTALISWLLRLPEPSKALVTSREYSRAFRSSTILLELRGMNESEAYELIQERLKMLRIDKLVRDLSQFAPLVAATGGNPKAITMALGYIKYQRQPLQQVLEDLYAARGELFDDLFTRCWSLLDEAARRTLLVMPFFVDSASAEALSATADVRGYVFDSAIERLSDLALIDIDQLNINSRPRYLLHPLVRTFVKMKMLTEPAFENSARERWVQYFLHKLKEIRAESRYLELDFIEENIQTLILVLEWSYITQHWQKFVDIYYWVEKFWSTRGMFDIRIKDCLRAVEAEQELGNIVGQISNYARLTRMASYRDELEQAQFYLSCAINLYNALDDETKLQALPKLLSAKAIVKLRLNQPQHALELLQKEGILVPDDYRVQYYTNICLYELGQFESAYNGFLQMLSRKIKSLGELGSQGGAANYLALLSIRNGNVEITKQYLEMADNIAKKIEHRRLKSETQRTLASFLAATGKVEDAISVLENAINEFERIGMRHNLIEANEELSLLKAGKITLPKS